MKCVSLDCSTKYIIGGFSIEGSQKAGAITLQLYTINPMKLATKYDPCLRGQGDDVGIIIFEKIKFFGRMTRQGIEPATSRTRVRNDTSKPSPLGKKGHQNLEVDPLPFF